MREPSSLRICTETAKLKCLKFWHTPRKYAARSWSRRKSSIADLTDAEASVVQPRTVVDLGVEILASGESFVLFYEVEDVERHLIVAAPRDIGKAIVCDSRHYIHADSWAQRKFFLSQDTPEEL